MSEASELKTEISELDDEALQKRFVALFDDGQGDNARRTFVAYCRAHNYSPVEITLLYGRNLFQRLRNMLDRQDKLLEEYKATNKFLAEQVRRLNGGKAILVPRPEIAKRGERFQRAVRDKFGDTRGAKSAACQALGTSPGQFDRLAKGVDVTDAIIDLIENLPEPAARRVVTPNKKAKAPKKIEAPRLVELERRFSHIPKPRKFGPRSNMTAEELKHIGQSLFGEDWIRPLACFLRYGEYHLTRFINGDTSRYIRTEAAEYIRRIEAEAKVLPRVSVLPLPAPTEVIPSSEPL